MQPPQSVAQIRQAFLDYFAGHGHTVVPSHSLLPPADPTLLFVNAGMVQFKDYFTGARQAPFKTATSTQKCLRVSGKHNDLENVGRTKRHHTLFEMLGNFSFGDYFKRGAIEHAWHFLTEVLGLDPARLVVTYFAGNDKVAGDVEARQLWKEIANLPDERIVPMGEKDNFWAMGDTGPCGPCTEIYFDLEPEQGAACTLLADDGRYMEIWNCVFMQYDARAGVLSPLPAPCVDTGMGLERVASVVQGANSNYGTDLFMGLIELMEKRSGQTYGGRFDPENTVSGDPDIERDVAFRVIADHARATAFLIAEGVYPDSDGRGYVLRRVMRRAIRFSRKLGVEKAFLYEIAGAVADSLADAFPELAPAKSLIQKLARQEEDRFSRTLADGEALIAHEIDKIRQSGAPKMLGGALVFLLHDTHGFPDDLTALIAAEAGFAIDHQGFADAMAQQRARGKASWKKTADSMAAVAAQVGHASAFIGYERQSAEVHVQAIFVAGEPVDAAVAGDDALVALSMTPFYAEGGGQIGDSGRFVWAAGDALVSDTRKSHDVYLHEVTVQSGSLHKGQSIFAQVDSARRSAIQAHHSATHLLHKALRDVLGPHVKQRGSLVLPDRLRFDFAHYAALSAEEIRSAELHVLTRVVGNAAAEVTQSSMDEAVARGAMAFFGDKYGDIVRVVQLDDATELCGGTHVARTGDIGLLKIISETAVSAGVRRIEAVCHVAALNHVQDQLGVLSDISRRLNTPAEGIGDRLEKLSEQLKVSEREIQHWKHKALTAKTTDDANLIERQVGEFKAVFRSVQGVDATALRNLADQMRDQIGSGVVAILSDTGDNKALMLIAVTKDLTDRVQAGKIIGTLAPLLGGRGGGRPDFAQAGGALPANSAVLSEAFFGSLA